MVFVTCDHNLDCFGKTTDHPPDTSKNSLINLAKFLHFLIPKLKTISEKNSSEMCVSSFYAHSPSIETAYTLR